MVNILARGCDKPAVMLPTSPHSLPSDWTAVHIDRQGKTVARSGFHSGSMTQRLLALGPQGGEGTLVLSSCCTKTQLAH